MGSHLQPLEQGAMRRGPHPREEITAFAALAGAADASSADIRRLVAPGLPARIWHRVFPFLPRERTADGASVVWHPLGRGWHLAVECVHARRPIRWRLSGAYLQWPQSDLASPADLVDFDDIPIADWSLAVPDPDFRAFCRRGCVALRLSELVARWALEVGPSRAGRALLGCHPRRAPGRLEIG